mgnify:CR=1 FL=1
MNVTWTPIGNGAMTFLVRIKDRTLLFDGARRRLASTLIPELEAICLRAEAAGGWNPESQLVDGSRLRGGASTAGSVR